MGHSRGGRESKSSKTRDSASPGRPHLLPASVILYPLSSCRRWYTTKAMTSKMTSCRMKQLLFLKMKCSGPSSETRMTLERYSARTKMKRPGLNLPVNGQRPRRRRRKGNEERRRRNGKKRNVPLQPRSDALVFLTRYVLQQKRKLNKTTESGDLTSVALRSPDMISEYLSMMQARSFSKMSALELQDRLIPGTCTLACLSEGFS